MTKIIRFWWAFTCFTIFLKHYTSLASLVSEVEKDGTATIIFLFLYFKNFINCVSPCVNMKIYFKKKINWFEHFVWKWHYGNWRGDKFSQNTITPQFQRHRKVELNSLGFATCARSLWRPSMSVTCILKENRHPTVQVSMLMDPAHGSALPHQWPGPPLWDGGKPP